MCSAVIVHVTGDIICWGTQMYKKEMIWAQERTLPPSNYKAVSVYAPKSKG
jgi:hypothetical protein